MKGVGNVRLSRLAWPAAALLLLLLFNLVFTEGFFRVEIRDGRLYGSLIDVLNRGAPVMLVALGMTLVIATGGVDLSVGAVMAISGSVAAWLISETGWGVGPLILVTLGATVAAGCWNGALVSLFGVQPIVATLILMVSGRGIAQLITQGQIITFEHPGFSFIGGGTLWGVPFTVVTVAAVSAGLGLLTRGTAMGLFIEAVGDNETASRYAGLSPRDIKTMVYALSGLCAGIAGMIVASDIKAADANNAGLYVELDGILAVVIGGTALTGGRFSLVGSLVGALLIQTVTTTILTRGVPVEYTLVVKALVVLIVCLLQSDRLRGLIMRSKE